jgi:ribonuclease-3
MGDHAPLEAALGHTFSDPSLLRTALTHRSYLYETEAGSGDESNERLEYLGDAVLELVVSEHLYRRFDLPEGSMTQTRASVVDEASLTEVAQELGLGDHLVLGSGEEASGGREKPSILSDAMEAVIGAVYLDGGLAAARSLVASRWERLLAERAAAPGVLDSKTRLQEVLAADGRVPAYEVVGEGPDHQRRFTATVTVGDAVLGTGEGTSKKRAEQAAARAALDGLPAGDA